MASTGNKMLALRGVAALEALRSCDGSVPSETQRNIIAGWPGWGPLAPAFDPSPDKGWAEINDRLIQLLDDEAYRSAAESVDNSFYTSDHVVDTVFELLGRSGCDVHAGKGVRILEPGCGSGRFIARTPPGWDVRWTGVERDPTSAAVAAALHPGAEIVAAPLEKVTLVEDSFDAVVGNVPFSSQGVYDRAAERWSDSLHLYFLERAIDAVHPGGYVALVISRFAVDGKELWRALESKASFIGALRLPSGAFHAEGTEVAADIVVVRKGASGVGWRPSTNDSTPRRYVVQGNGNAAATEVSPYWEDHPHHVAGTMVATGNYHNPLAVRAGPDPWVELRRAVEAVAEKIETAPYEPAHEVGPTDFAVVTDSEGRLEGTFVLEEDGRVLRVRGGRLAEVSRPSKELRALIELRDAATRLLELEADVDLPDWALVEPRATALSLYRRYVERFGPLNRGTLHEGKIDADTGLPSLSWRRPPMGGFRGDPGFVSVLALEKYDQETNEAEPAAILLGRVNRRPQRIERADTPGEALSVCLGETGRLDLARVAGLLGLATSEEAVEALGELVYADPEAGGAWVPARDYLAGNVRAKLVAAREAAATDDRYGRNVEALDAVVPPELGPLEIDMHLGAPWVTESDITEFLEELLGRAPTVEHVEATSSWHVEVYGSTPAAMTTWGTSRIDGFKLCEMALNGRTPVVYDEVWDGNQHRNRKVRNPEQTLAAAEKLAAIDERFGSWVWEDPDRAERICREYNQRFSSHVIRQADGSHLSFPNLSAGLDLWPWQRDMIDRIISGPAAFCAHNVGLGKTLTAVGAAMTLRRLGLASKPMLVVPNHLLEQIAREAAQAFPLGKFLVAGKDDLAGDARRLFAARCATGDWDAVIMTHQGFTSIPTDPSVEEAWIKEQKATLADYLRSQGSGGGTRAAAKEIARSLRSLESRLVALRTNANDPATVLFEQLGVDWVGVDEVSQSFRRLPIAGRAEGFSFGSSKRATDLLMKARWLQKRRGAAPSLAFFSGTPWSNTLAETFVWQTYLQPDRLEEAGLSSFDAWAAVFVKRETRVEVAPDGSGFRTATRPVGLRNLPELRTMLGEVMDIVPADAVDLERPEADVENVVVQPTPEQRAFVKSLVQRADKIRGGVVQRDQDNMLVICNDGRKVALDPALVGVGGQNAKLDALADRVAQVFHETKGQRFGDSDVPGAFQLIFCDIGTPGAKGSQTYGRIRDRLTARGLPAERVRWIHEATTDKARAALFTACRSGAVSVLLASTEKAGLGTNVQTRLRAIHHADAPHRPSDMEQRDGRGIRPGNLNPRVLVVRYVSEGTFDAYMWQALERKAASFSHMFTADPTVREIDDLGEVVLSYGEVKALASGNPLLLQQAEAQATVRRLRTMKSVDSQSVWAARRQADRAEREADEIEGRLKHVEDLGKERIEWAGKERHVALTELGEMAFSIARGSRSYRYPVRVGATGIEISIRRGEVGRIDLLVRHLYRDTFDASFPSRELRMSREAAAELIAGELDGFFGDLKGRARAMRRTIDGRRATAEEARRLVETYVFSHEAELREAERRLAAINAEIDESMELEDVAQAA